MQIAVLIILVTALLVLGREILKSGKQEPQPREPTDAERRSALPKLGKPKAAAPKKTPASARKSEPHSADPEVDLSNLVPLPEDLSYPENTLVSEEDIEEVLKNARSVSERLHARQAILSGVSSSTIEPAELTELVLSDPALAGQILKIVNSAFYGLSQPVASVFRAVLLLGHVEIRNLIWRNTVSASADQTEKSISTLLDKFWQHSFEVSRAAYAISRSLSLPEPDEISTAGLLHDVGKIISLSAWPDRFKDLYRTIRFAHHGILTEEVDKLGIDHAALGGKIVKGWGLPDQTSILITNHHAPSYLKPSEIEDRQLDTCRRDLTILHIADILCHSTHGNPDDPIYRPKPGWVKSLQPVGGLKALCTPNVLRALPERGSTIMKTVEQDLEPTSS